MGEKNKLADHAARYRAVHKSSTQVPPRPVSLSKVDIVSKAAYKVIHTTIKKPVEAFSTLW